MSTPTPMVPTRQRTRILGAGPQPQSPRDRQRAWPSDPPSSQVDGSSIRWTLVDIERYEVARGDAVVGYVDVVGHVFVALVGARYDRATEVAQTLTFMTAIEILAASEEDWAA